MRIKMGTLTLHKLAPGDFRMLTSREVRDLKKLPKEDDAKRKPSDVPKPSRRS